MSLPRLSSREGHPIGGFHHRLTFYQPGLPGSDGGATPDSPVFSTWGDVRPLRGQELDKAKQIAQEVEHIVSIPFQPVNENYIIGFEGRKFLIKYIEDPDERQFFLDIYAEEIGQNAGQVTNWAAPAPPGPPPAPVAPSGAWQTFDANASVAAAPLVQIKADGGADGITLTIEGQEGEWLYAANVGELGGIVTLVDKNGALIGGYEAYDLASAAQTTVLAYTGGSWLVFYG
jgi:SPP1 family predicted phage head-tail adaptor